MLHEAMDMFQCFTCTVLFGTTAGDDYTPVVNQLVFIADTDRLCTDIPITSDTIYEVDEFFNVVLTTDDDDIDLDPDAGTVTIIDVDGTWNL